MAQYDFSEATLTAGLLNLNSVTTIVDPNAPALAAPYDMPADGASYDYDLLDGAVTPWMWSTASLLAADAHLLFILPTLALIPRPWLILLRSRPRAR
jgi:hypothetical protein